MQIRLEPCLNMLETCKTGNVEFDFETHVDIVTPGCVANPIENPTGAHSSLPQSTLQMGLQLCVHNYPGIHSYRNMFIALQVAQQVCRLTPWQSRTILFKIL